MDRENKSAKWTLFPGMQESGTRCRLRTEARPREMFPSIFVESKLNYNRAQRDNRDLNEIFHQLVTLSREGVTSKVIAKLLQRNYDRTRDFRKSVMAALSNLKGKVFFHRDFRIGFRGWPNSSTFLCDGSRYGLRTILESSRRFHPKQHKIPRSAANEYVACKRIDLRESL